MIRGTWVYRDGQLIEKHLAPPLHERLPSNFPAPMVIRDSMDSLIGQHDGKTYESKSALRRSYKDHGIVEMGTDAPTTAAPRARPSGMDSDVGEAFAKVKAGYKPTLAPNIAPEDL